MSIRPAIFIAVATAALAVGGHARGDFSPASSTVLFTNSGHDYAPSVVQIGSTAHFVWCGYAATQNFPGGTDVIMYRSLDVSTSQWSSISTVFEPAASTSAWDGKYTCDPSVVAGSFTNPDDSQTYSYALYYSGAKQGTDGRIGLAYSNNGTTWIRYSGNPIIVPSVDPTTKYGAGQPEVANLNGTIYLMHTDVTENGSQWLVRTSTNGRTFGSASPVSVSGLPAPTIKSHAGFAYDAANGYWYGAWPQEGRAGEFDSYEFVIARIAAANLTGGGSWEQLGFINSNMTGHAINSGPGLVRTNYGALSDVTNIAVVHNVGAVDPSTWDLAYTYWRPTPSTLQLRHYSNTSTGYQQVTTGIAAPGFSTLTASLGYIFMAPQSGTQPLYGCQSSSYADFFVSLQSDCEGGGAFKLGVNGFIYSSSQTGTQAIYRCFAGGVTHFASTDSGCSGYTQQGLLGYAKTSP